MSYKNDRNVKDNLESAESRLQCIAGVSNLKVPVTCIAAYNSSYVRKPNGNFDQYQVMDASCVEDFHCSEEVGCSGKFNCEKLYSRGFEIYTCYAGYTSKTNSELEPFECKSNYLAKTSYQEVTNRYHNVAYPQIALLSFDAQGIHNRGNRMLKTSYYLKKDTFSLTANSLQNITFDNTGRVGSTIPMQVDGEETQVFRPWLLEADIKCLNCNACNDCQGSCHSSCQQCTTNCHGDCYSACDNCTAQCFSTCNACEGCTADCYSSCNGSCHDGCYSSCQRTCYATCHAGCIDQCNTVCVSHTACFNKCDSAYGCTDCTASCNGNCYSTCQNYTGGGGVDCSTDCQGCTAACYSCNGCTSCNNCQTCVGSTCNSCNGACTNVVWCHPSLYSACTTYCVGVQGCTSCVENTGEKGDPPIPTCENSHGQLDASYPVTNPKITEIYCECYGCMNTVSGGEGCHNDYGYGGKNKLIVVTNDGHAFEYFIDGEAVVAAGGTERTLEDLAEMFSGDGPGGAKLTKDTKLFNKDSSGNIESTKSYGEFQGHCQNCAALTACSGTYCPGTYIDPQYKGLSPTGTQCNGDQNLGCGPVTGCPSGCTSGAYGPGSSGWQG